VEFLWGRIGKCVMTWIFNDGASTVNLTNAASTAEVMFRLKKLLKAVGWTVPSSSDGTTYNASGDQITTDGSGAGGLDNNYAWYRLQDPGGLREFVFQRSTNEYTWKSYYSAAAKFSGGSPDATTLPTATDGQQVIGTGGSFDSSWGWQSVSVANYRWHIGADNAAVGGVYGFYIVARRKTTGAAHRRLVLDPMKVGSYPDGSVGDADVDPSVTWMGSANTFTTGSPTIGTWYKYGLSGASWDTAPQVVGIAGFPGSVAISPYSGQDLGIAPLYHSTTVSKDQIKGWSTALEWVGVGARTTYDTLGLTTATARIIFDDASFPWPQSVVPVP
jgi:hypothetical protein